MRSYLGRVTRRLPTQRFAGDSREVVIEMSREVAEQILMTLEDYEVSAPLAELREALSVVLATDTVIVQFGATSS